MANPEQALATQLANIEKRTGKSLAELAVIVRQCGRSKHGEIRDYLKTELGMGHGDANTLVHHVLQSDGASAAAASGFSNEDIVAALYSGPKAALRPIHDAVMARLAGFGEFEIAAKKTYLSLRRKKQFAMLGPATNSRVELGLNIKSLPAHARLLEQPANSMCNYKIKLVAVEDVDAQLFDWLRQAFDAAG